MKTGRMRVGVFGSVGMMHSELNVCQLGAQVAILPVSHVGEPRERNAMPTYTTGSITRFTAVAASFHIARNVSIICMHASTSTSSGRILHLVVVEERQ